LEALSNRPTEDELPHVGDRFGDLTFPQRGERGCRLLRARDDLLEVVVPAEGVIGGLEAKLLLL
jgi:hypothetical protein